MTHRKYLTLDKAILLGNMFVNSQFNYVPPMWMLCLYCKMKVLL